MISALHQQVRRTIRRHALLPEGSRVVVGLSGGSDSVALTALLLELAEHGGFSVAGCAHLNHQLRDTAGRDEEFCRALAGKLGVPILCERAGVKDSAARLGVSIEEGARKIRYSFLERAAETLNADRIAVGHTQDDQAETFLMKLMRGAGQAGLGSIYPRRGKVIRPLLEVSRHDLRAWLTLRAQDWVDDETNEDIENPRNRVRLHVLPELGRALQGDPRPAIARTAALLREDGEWLDGAAQREFEALAQPTADGLAFDVRHLTGLPGPIQARVVRTGLSRLGGDREVSQEHVEAARAVLRGEAGAADVPGGRVELSRDLLVLLERKVSPK